MTRGAHVGEHDAVATDEEDSQDAYRRQLIAETEARRAATPRWERVAVPLLVIVLVCLTFAVIYDGRDDEMLHETIERWFRG